jgi:peroxiredoxin
MKALFHGIRVLAAGVALIALIVSPLKAQVVQGCIEGSPVKKAALGYYFGNKRLVADSVKLDAKGCFAYQGAKMRPGFYTFFLDTAHAFDFFYGGSPVSITGSYTALRAVDFKDEDNIRFQEFQNLGMAVQRDFEAGALTAEQAQAAYAEKTTAWEQQNGGSRFGKLILARNPMGTRTAVEPGGVERWTFAFWQGQPLMDPAYFRSPFFQSAIELFFDKAIIQDPDTVVASLSVFFDMPKDTAAQKFSVAFLTNKYETSNLMGHDKAFVWMVNRFYRTGYAKWEKPEALAKIIKKADDIGMNMIGLQAPDFGYFESTGRPRRLKEAMGSYTLLVIYDATCGHCQENLPKFLETHKKFASKGLKTVAITNELTLEEWKSFIDKKGMLGVPGWSNGSDVATDRVTFRHYYHVPTTPTVLVLDTNHKIIAKALAPEDLEDFLSKKMP